MLLPASRRVPRPLPGVCLALVLGLCAGPGLQASRSGAPPSPPAAGEPDDGAIRELLMVYELRAPRGYRSLENDLLAAVVREVSGPGLRIWTDDTILPVTARPFTPEGAAWMKLLAALQPEIRALALTGPLGEDRKTAAALVRRFRALHRAAPGLDAARVAGQLRQAMRDVLVVRLERRFGLDLARLEAVLSDPDRETRGRAHFRLEFRVDQARSWCELLTRLEGGRPVGATARLLEVGTAHLDAVEQLAHGLAQRFHDLTSLGPQVEVSAEEMEAFYREFPQFRP